MIDNPLSRLLLVMDHHHHFFHLRNVTEICIAWYDPTMKPNKEEDVLIGTNPQA
ncbi:hypothetical protein PGTUg99_037143 [Puccinia graminis f. sp. tritici]|uniref:Uncharacterized protein n=1 Tax=Puccinia graminis f. sp. tritici TaxID=56615 RepID=A0A5B0RQH0_PUCGR|nr:hypothetical protein PGTUg99_037143 [Puccinia graminis f. sp. tritici]